MGRKHKERGRRSEVKTIPEERAGGGVWAGRGGAGRRGLAGRGLGVVGGLVGGGPTGRPGWSLLPLVRCRMRGLIGKHFGAHTC